LIKDDPMFVTSVNL